MGRLFVAANLDHLSIVNPVLTAKPMSLAVWYKPTNLPAAQSSLLALQSNTTANRQFQVAVNPTGNVQALERGTAAGTGVSTGTMTTGVWAHCAATFTSGSTGARIAYLNGVGGTANTTSVATAPVPERTDMGAFFSATIGTWAFAADGILATAGIWNVVLTAAEVMALARGVNPLRIRPGALKFDAPLWGTGSPEPDYTAGQRALALTGTPAVAAQPPVAAVFAV